MALHHHHHHPSAAPPPFPPPPLPADAAPSIPARTRFNSTSPGHASSSRRRTSHHGSAAAVGSKRQSIPPAASPEVISSLITSLSGISKPADDYFEGNTIPPSTSSSTLGPPYVPSKSTAAASSASVPRSSSHGSFGVDYGAYAKPGLGEVREDPESLDDIAASAPIIRTSKPTSGYSPLSPPKTPRSRASRENAHGGLRSIIRSSSNPSRPTSRDSARHDDANSIGGLSIERSTEPPEPELHRRNSQDSWAKKNGRSYKGLMYMNSRERLRENEERKRNSASSLRKSHSFSTLNGAAGGAGGSGSGGPVIASASVAGKPDAFLAETAISEEPTTSEGQSPREHRHRIMDGSPRPIPNRESSLRKATPSGKRGGGRRPLRDGADAPVEMDAVSAPDSRDYSGRKTRSGRKVPARLDLETPTKGKASSVVEYPDGIPAPSQLDTPNTQRFLETIRDDYLAFDNHTPDREDDDDDGAPFPAVSQNRRRSVQSLDRNSRRRSIPLDSDGRPKRSSSRLKRLSRPTSPSGDASKVSQELIRDTDSVGAPLERLDSADSIDDAVDAYLSAPRLSQKIRHPQTGRVICFSEVGDPEGSAVFCCVGMGLTRYITAFYDELALTLKLRLITPDRPGVGDSEPYSDGTSTPLNWPDDVYAICQALKITKFSILAHSAGAIYALATALRMPQHIRGTIQLLAPWIPPSQMNVFGGSQNLPPTNAIPTSQRILRALPTPMLKVANSSFMSATSTSITTSLPKNSRRTKRRSTGQVKESSTATRNVTPALDKENVVQGNQKKTDGTTGRNGADPGAMSNSSTNSAHRRSAPANVESSENAVQAAEIDPIADQERQMTYDTRLTHAIWELATTGANPAVDLLICLERRHTIGFRYVDINRSVTIHHGSRDTRVPVDNVRWLGKTMRRCEVRVLEGEGHGLMASAGVMGSVLMEISKEWEDWMRATGADGRKERERSRRGTLHR